MPSFVIAALAGLAQPDFPDNRDQYSIWLQHGCRLQQVGYSGGEPADHIEFCTCFDTNVSETADSETYRVLALGMQGALREQSLIEDWEGARDTAVTVAGAMSPAAQAGFGPILQNSLMACLSLSYQEE